MFCMGGNSTPTKFVHCVDVIHIEPGRKKGGKRLESFDFLSVETVSPNGVATPYFVPTKRHSPSLDFDSVLSKADADEVDDEVDIESSLLSSQSI